MIKKTTILLITTLCILTSVQAATLKDEIAGLYAAFFNRAPDKAGFDMWVSQDDGSGSVLKTIASGFAEHPTFTSTYGDLNDEEFVSLVYQNVLGRAGDAKGIADQVAALNNGTYKKRSDFIAGFVQSALTLELTPENFPTLTAQELSDAQARQDLLQNKAEVSQYFVSQLGAYTNVQNAVSPEEDDAYKASINIISNVTEETSTKQTAQNLILAVKSEGTDSIAIINQIKEQYGVIVDDSDAIRSAKAAIDTTPSDENNAPIASNVSVSSSLDTPYVQIPLLATDNDNDTISYNLQSPFGVSSCSQ